MTATLYKIETSSELAARSVAKHIEQFGGRVIRRGWALLTDHQFTSAQLDQVWRYVSRTTDLISEDDEAVWYARYVTNPLHVVGEC